MADHSVWVKRSNGERVKLAECETRAYAELIAAALKAYKPAPILEAAQSAAFIDAFKLDPVKVVWEAESR